MERAEVQSFNGICFARELPEGVLMAYNSLSSEISKFPACFSSRILSDCNSKNVNQKATPL